MKLDCPRCHAVLEFSEKRPSFCSHCGQALARGRPAAADDEAATLPPPPRGDTSNAAIDPEAATLPPSAPPADAFDGDPGTVGNYRLLRVLGSGGMGTVYEAEQVGTGRRVALKLIAAEYAAARDAVQRFRREGKLASMIAHPRCVFVLATEEQDGRPYIVMELMPGSTLQDLVKEKGPLPPDEAVTKILDVIDGLAEAHRLGVVHRDVKPSNCFLEADGRVKIGDFGLSKSLAGTARLTRTGAFMGTPLYAAPEQIRAEPATQQTDVYAVAATLYFLLAGKAPFQSPDATATMARIVCDDPPPLRTVRPDVPLLLDRAILKGLERDRSRRYRGLDEFRLALRPFAPVRPAGGLGVRFAAYLSGWLTRALGRRG